MRRLCFSWVVSLLLVFAQHGAVLHELSHLSHGTPSHGVTLRPGEQLENGLCLTCEAFAQVANPAAGASVSPAIDPAVLVPIPDPGYAIVGTDVPQPRSRGPPQV
jgi:hypothetical protein